MSGRALLVRLGELDGEGAARNAGGFAARALGGGRLPSWVAAWFALFCADTLDPVVALTYDDGPNPDDTPRLLDLLARRDARATFFVLAEHAEQHPELVRRIVADGHELALHGVDHRSLLTYGTVAGVRRVLDARRRVERISGTRIRRYRPPYGEYRPGQSVGLRLAGLETVIWSGDARDWQDDAAELVAGRAIAALHPGAIVLLHDRRADLDSLGPDESAPSFDRAAVLGALLDALDERGMRSLTVDDLVDGRIAVRSLARYDRKATR